MNSLFNICLNNCTEDRLELSIIDMNIKHPQPMKFKLAKTLNLLDPLIKKFVLPRRKQPYTFPRKNLYFLTTTTTSIPFLYTATTNPSQSILFIYCHGSGSTLNHVYDYINKINWKYNVATIAYDYTGDGESGKEFVSYENDLRCVLAWAVKQGYDLRRVILCGFSLGSYSALCLKGQMPRVLISPICGLTSYIEEQPRIYEGEKFDNITQALQLKSHVWITHCTKELIPISHAKMLKDALLRNNTTEQITFTEIKEGYDHKSAPAFLCGKLFAEFLVKMMKVSKEEQMTEETKLLKSQLLELTKSLTITSSIGEKNNA